MNKLDRLKIICIVLAVVIGIFSLTPPGQWLTDALTRGTKLVDFQDVSQDYPFSLHVLDVGKADAICIAVDMTGSRYVAGSEYADEDGVKNNYVLFVPNNSLRKEQTAAFIAYCFAEDAA